MKSKALVLGAHPPFEGPWVSLMGAEKWKVLVEGHPPLNGDVRDVVNLEFKDQYFPLNPKELEFDGESYDAGSVRVHLSEADGVGTVTVYAESVEE
jgi:hypothetical protein